MCIDMCIDMCTAVLRGGILHYYITRPPVHALRACAASPCCHARHCPVAVRGIALLPCAALPCCSARNCPLSRHCPFGCFARATPAHRGHNYKGHNYVCQGNACTPRPPTSPPAIYSPTPTAIPTPPPALRTPAPSTSGSSGYTLPPLFGGVPSVRP